MSQRLERLTRIYNRLRTGPVTIPIISKWAKSANLKVSERQLYRDLNDLQFWHMADGERVVEIAGEKNKKTWKLEYVESSERITEFDINSFFLFKNFVPDSIQLHRKGSMEKFEQILYKNFSNNKYQKQVEAAELYLRKSNCQDSNYGEIEHNIFEQMLWALQNGREIIVLADEINATNIDFSKYPLPVRLLPFEMIFHRGRVYISGLHLDTGKLLIYNVTDSLKIELTNDAFSRKKYLKKYKEQLACRFFISEIKNDKVYNIKLEFSEGYGFSMQKVFLHPTAKWQQLKNGNYLLQMRCGITRELIGYLGYSLDQVKVLQPKALRDLVMKKFKDALDLYHGKEINGDAANDDY